MKGRIAMKPLHIIAILTGTLAFAVAANANPPEGGHQDDAHHEDASHDKHNAHQDDAHGDGHDNGDHHEDDSHHGE